MCSVIRILYLILFYLIYRVTDLVLLLVMLVQTILNIFSGEPSASIKLFGKSLGVYLLQISEFLSYASDEKPFPFSDWPQAEEKAASVDADAEPLNSLKEDDTKTVNDRSSESSDTSKKA